MSDENTPGPALTVTVEEWERRLKTWDDIERLRKWVEQNAKPALEAANGDPVEAAIKVMRSSKNLVEVLIPPLQGIMSQSIAVLKAAGILSDDPKPTGSRKTPEEEK